MKDLKDRKRSIDVNKLTEEQLVEIQTLLGDKIRKIVDIACEDANKLLNVYGLRTKMEIVLEEMENK